LCEDDLAEFLRTRFRKSLEALTKPIGTAFAHGSPECFLTSGGDDHGECSDAGRIY
jgi:hypothetical protein